MDLLNTSAELMEPGLEASQDGGRTLPRLHVHIENSAIYQALRNQVESLGTTLKTWINELLTLILSEPPVVKENRIDDLACMLKIFRSLPMDDVRQLAQKTRRQPEDMIAFIFDKGLDVCKANNPD